MATASLNTRIIFGVKVKQLRLQQGLSFSELSKRSGLSVSYLNEIEKGKKYPKEDKIRALSGSLETTFDYLVSGALSKKLEPIAELLQSNLLNELPLELFGIDLAKLIEIVAEAPTKIGAFIAALIEISRKYEVREENFYFAALRAYQRLYNNYFEELEDAADELLAKYSINEENPLTNDKMFEILQKDFNYTIDRESLKNYPELSGLRSIFVPSKRSLMLHEDLTESQLRFVLAKEIGFSFLKIKERPYTSSLVRLVSFDQVLMKLKASYFAGATLIKRDQLVRDLQFFFSRKRWDAKGFMALINQYGASPEMFFQRLTNLLPRFFGLNDLFFLRFNNEPGTDYFLSTKELHLGRQHNPYGNEIEEHYCRRWVTIWLLKDLFELQDAGEKKNMTLGIQRSKYIGTEDEYLCITLARSGYPTPNLNVSVTIGFAVDDNLKRVVKFIDDPVIISRPVNQTCERCPANDCEDRAAEPSIIEENKRRKLMIERLEQLGV